MKILLTLVFFSSVIIFNVQQTFSQEPENTKTHEVEKVEIKLIAGLDEPRGWCVDLFAHLTNALPLGGFQGHDCFLYMGNGPTEDQGFDVNRFNLTGELQLVYYDVCLTMHDPNPGSFVAAESCNQGHAQKFLKTSQGHIKPINEPNLCLTLGRLTVPGGGRLAPIGTRPPASNAGIPQIRRLTFEACTGSEGERQQWTFRSGVYEPKVQTQKQRFFKN